MKLIIVAYLLLLVALMSRAQTLKGKEESVHTTKKTKLPARISKNCSKVHNKNMARGCAGNTSQLHKYDNFAPIPKGVQFTIWTEFANKGNWFVMIDVSVLHGCTQRLQLLDKSHFMCNDNRSMYYHHYNSLLLCFEKGHEVGAALKKECLTPARSGMPDSASSLAIFWTNWTFTVPGERKKTPKQSGMNSAAISSSTLYIFVTPFTWLLVGRMQFSKAST